MNYETALKELETVVEKMESGQLSLEDSLKSFEEGVKLARLCQNSLKEAEQKVQILIEQNGELRPEPFLVENES
jgi:exodeoxyribonuclease VII small subunit